MNPLHLLVVDDEPGMRMAVARALENYGFVMPEIEGETRFIIQQAGTGEDAVEILDGTPMDILLLDYKLPGMSGLDVLDHVTEKSIDCLIVMITAYASLETAVTATKRGAYDFLAKPFTPDELKAAVHKAAKHLVLQRQARKLAEEKRQVRFQLTSVVAHELKAPLGAIEGYLYLLRDRPAGDNLSAYDQAINRSLIRLAGMRKLITDLLDLTRIESGQKKRELTVVDVGQVAQQAVETVTPDANDRDISIELHAEGPLSLNADAGEIEIVLNNLLTNAVKYNRPSGKVTAVLKGDDEKITVSVTDTGIGMTPEEAQRLFGEFVRIKNQKTKNIMGTGLGLSILKRIVQLYGGDVSVQSEPDVGSTFTVVLRKDFQPKKADEE